MQLATLLATTLANADNGGTGDLFGLLLPFIGIGAIMYFLLIRPQRRRMREQAELQRSVGVGDEVVTTSGLYGFITGEDGPSRFWLEVDENVQIRISRAAVQQKVDTSESESAPSDDVASEHRSDDETDDTTDDAPGSDDES